MTYLELCNAVRADANVQGTISTTVTQTGIFGNIVRWVNDAYLDIQAMHDNWEFLLVEDSATLSTGSRELSLDASGLYERIVTGSVWLSDGYTKMQQKDWVSFNRVYPKNGDIKTGKPAMFTEIPHDTTTLRFEKEAGSDYTVNFQAYKYPVELDGDADVPLFSARYHSLIKYRALMKYAGYYNAQEVMSLAQFEFNGKIKDMERDLLPKNMFFTVPLV